MNSSQNLALNLALSPATWDLTADQIPNQINNIPTCIHKVKEFLQKNSKEHLITAACIYNLSESTLQSSISWSQTMKCDEQNQILQEHQKNAIHLFIQFLLACQIQSIYSLIYNIICCYGIPSTIVVTACMPEPRIFHSPGLPAYIAASFHR